VNPAFPEDTLTWEECVRRTKANHPDIISAGEKVKQARSDKNIALSDMLPDLTFAGSGRESKTSTRDAAKTYEYSVTGTQLLFDGFKTFSEVSSSIKTLNAQQYDYAVTSSNIRLDLRSAFVDLLKTQELIFLTENIAERRRQSLKLVRLRYEAGREHKGSLLTAEADLARAEFEIEQAKRDILLGQRQLSKELGLAGMENMKVEGEFSLGEDYGIKPGFERLAEINPFLRELIAKKDAARYDLRSSRLDFFPKVYLNGSTSMTDSDWPPKGDGWSGGISVSFPLFEGGSRFSEVTKARSKLRQLEADERSGRNTVLVTLESTWKELKDAITYVSVQKKFLDAAEERARISVAQYETGLMSFDDWTIIEDNLVTTKKAYLDAQRDMLLAEAYWIQAIGGTLEYD
jgi:outer membrane protein TolC